VRRPVLVLTRAQGFCRRCIFARLFAGKSYSSELQKSNIDVTKACTGVFVASRVIYTVGFSQYSSGGSILYNIPYVHTDSYLGADRR